MNRKYHVQYAHRISKQDLQDLWITCFPEDGNGFAVRFLEGYFKPEQAVCVVSEPDNRLVSALYWLPCTYHVNGVTGEFLYIYAMGTYPEFRRQGNLRRMLEFTERHCQKCKIDGMVLYAMDTSKSVVETFGMKPILTLEESFLDVLQNRDRIAWCTGTFDDFQRLRNHYLSMLPGYIYWKERELRFIYEDLKQNDKIHFFREQGILHYAVFEQTKTGYILEESDRAETFLPAMSRKVILRKPGKGIYAGHIKTYTEKLPDQIAKELYFNLILK